MQETMKKLRAAGGALAMVLMILSIGVRPSAAGEMNELAPQQSVPPPSKPASSQTDPSTVLGIPSDSAPDPYKDKMDSSRSKALSDDRHRKLQDDSAKLLQMATDLKAEVDHTPKDQLSLIVIRKATDIEKLAHDIREREKN